MPENLIDDPKLDTTRAAAHVGCSPRTLEKWRQTGEGPAFLKLGRSVVYVQSDLDRWLAACRHRQGSRRPSSKGVESAVGDRSPSAARSRTSTRTVMPILLPASIPARPSGTATSVAEVEAGRNCASFWGSP